MNRRGYTVTRCTVPGQPRWWYVVDPRGRWVGGPFELESEAKHRLAFIVEGLPTVVRPGARRR